MPLNLDWRKSCRCRPECRQEVTCWRDLENLEKLLTVMTSLESEAGRPLYVFSVHRLLIWVSFAYPITNIECVCEGLPRIDRALWSKCCAIRKRGSTLQANTSGEIEFQVYAIRNRVSYALLVFSYRRLTCPSHARFCLFHGSKRQCSDWVCNQQVCVLHRCVHRRSGSVMSYLLHIWLRNALWARLTRKQILVNIKYITKAQP